MPDDRGKLREIVWRELFPWLLLVRTFRIAAGLRAISLAALGALGTTAGWRLIGWVFQNSSDPALSRSVDAAVGAELGREPGWLVKLLSAWPWGEYRWSAGDPVGWIPFNLGLTDPLTSTPVQQLWAFRLLISPGTSYQVAAFLILCLLWALVVWAFFGGAITRIAAVGLAREDRVSFGQATAFARRKWQSYFFAPLFPLIGLILIAIPLAILGLLLRIDVGVLIGGIIWPLIILGGLLMAIIAIGLAFGWPLMWTTISTEGTDAFDALSRAYNYVRERPLHYLFYWFIAAVIGVLGWWLVTLFTQITLLAANWAVSWGSGSERLFQVLRPTPAEAGPIQWGSQLIDFWHGCVWLFAFSFLASFFWVAATAVYLLMRQVEDATELDEVHLEEDAPPDTLPELKSDELGVPGVE